MSLRKFMHPRNKYKRGPNFKYLALAYPEFCSIATVDLTGKVKIDFKNEENLRVLTEVLLKHDYKLDVKIPPNKLVPTLPLRLNYILWIEDLLKHASFNEIQETVGIDIGTGAVCIYPLLFAKMYGNQMIGTEVDETSVETAVKHIENNNFQHLIKVHKVNGDHIFKDIIEQGKIYHFTMCNPPFFEIGGSLGKVEKRLPPRNAPTGNEAELTVKGGERGFVIRMIDESVEFKDQVKVFTTMFGRKNNLLFLLKLLKRKNIENSTWTEFCQGRTTRWGLAWSFLPKDVIDLTNAPVIRKSGDCVAKLLNKQRPLDIEFPMDKFSSFDDLIHLLEELMEKLCVQIKELNLPIDDFNGWSCRLVAKNDTWSHARRKRRMAQRQMNQSDSCDAENENATSVVQSSSKETDNDDGSSNADEQKQSSDPTDPVLVCNFFVELIEHKEESENDGVRISMVFEKGSGGRNALERFKQYLINKLKVREYFEKQRARPNKQKRKRLKTSESDACKEAKSSSMENMECS